MFVEVEQELAELGEALRSEPLCPLSFDFRDRFADDAYRALAPPGHEDALAALVVGIGSPFEVTELLELAEQVPERLFADA